MAGHMTNKSDRNESNFFKAALIRALKTLAQTAVAMLPAAATISEINWMTVAQTAAYAGIVSLLTSVAFGLPEAPREGHDA